MASSFVNGGEAFLRKATRIAIEMNFPIAGRTAEQEEIIRDEIKAIRAEPYDPMAGEVENIGPTTAPKPKERSYKADPISKAWEETYGVGTLPPTLRPEIAQIDATLPRVTLKDGASFEDQGSKITQKPPPRPASALSLQQLWQRAGLDLVSRAKRLSCAWQPALPLKKASKSKVATTPCRRLLRMNERQPPPQISRRSTKMEALALKYNTFKMHRF
ncbi:hypothetical protein [Pseudogemmobacter faecipullorum]|uniref:hypothetical protein n=1 Tax=Pseudogemmobacter faecipullorum TaxID=2755041 RepID=UPI0021047EA9|nr:hypothetical protein [Pseudogemmobacter faecipullorum]